MSSMRLLIELDRIQVSITGPGSGYKLWCTIASARHRSPLSQHAFPEKTSIPLENEVQIEIEILTTPKFCGFYLPQLFYMLESKTLCFDCNHLKRKYFLRNFIQREVWKSPGGSAEKFFIRVIPEHIPAWKGHEGEKNQRGTRSYESLQRLDMSGVPYSTFS